MNSHVKEELSHGETELLYLQHCYRCGRLVYQVISPWSLLSYPYVKAAILSTYNDDPCGPCNQTMRVSKIL
jgi:hypothetical protein